MPTPETVTRWAVDLICCGLDDGTAILDTNEDAQAFRESYTSGPGVMGPDSPYGHDRKAIVRKARPDEKRRDSTFLIAGEPVVTPRQPVTEAGKALPFSGDYPKVAYITPSQVVAIEDEARAQAVANAARLREALVAEHGELGKDRPVDGCLACAVLAESPEVSLAEIERKAVERYLASPEFVERLADVLDQPVNYTGSDRVHERASAIARALNENRQAEEQSADGSGGMNDNDLRLPWHRETIGHANVQEIAAQVTRDLMVPLPDGIPANTDATWIVNADNKIVAFVGNGPRQTQNADAIIAAIQESGASGAIARALTTSTKDTTR